MKSKSCITICAAIAFFFPSYVIANTVIDFEQSLPGGLVATSYVQSTIVPASARVTDQYLNVGLIIDGAALVALPSGSAPSGFNGLAGIDGNGRIDYDTPVSFSFFAAGNDGVLGTTDFFGYSADLFGSSGNIITISAYGLDGLLVGQASYTETGNFTTPLTISGVGQFHSVTVDQTLYNTSSGGIALDLVQFGNISIAAIPEPQTYAMLLAGLSLLGFMARRKKQNIQSDHKVL
ncbi:PEP-CTERM sorting domain-containing protein [Nitrosomonas sp.]|uniref:PEP-CTERM sorting domain-containing protein n=1 Tax=Nitrosomonas sp. TaxID=42353 RepID=UPI0025E46999|nr:PEP-CTERM sorting domain-containing protein [Nitrosomonas sp.]